MTETRRTFLKKLGMLGALALVSPTGVIEAIVPKEDWGPVKGQAIVEEFVKYCHTRPRGDVGHSVCGVETLLDYKSLGWLMRGFSIGKDQRAGKYFNCTFDNNVILSREEFESFCNDALVHLKLAWRHGKQKGSWGVAPRTMTQKEAHKLVSRKP